MRGEVGRREHGVDGDDLLEERAHGAEGVPEDGREVHEGLSLLGEFQQRRLAVLRAVGPVARTHTGERNASERVILFHPPPTFKERPHAGFPQTRGDRPARARSVFDRELMLVSPHVLSHKRARLRRRTRSVSCSTCAGARGPSLERESSERAPRARASQEKKKRGPSLLRPPLFFFVWERCASIFFPARARARGRNGPEAFSGQKKLSGARFPNLAGPTGARGGAPTDTALLR